MEDIFKKLQKMSLNTPFYGTCSSSSTAAYMANVHPIAMFNNQHHGPLCKTYCCEHLQLHSPDDYIPTSIPVSPAA